MHTKLLSHRMPGLIGSWVIMIDLASLLVWDANKHGLLRCCYSLYAVRLPAIMETSWGCWTSQFRRNYFTIRKGKSILSIVVTQNALLCSGMTALMRASVLLR